MHSIYFSEASKMEDSYLICNSSLLPVSLSFAVSLGHSSRMWQHQMFFRLRDARLGHSLALVSRMLVDVSVQRL